MSPEEIDEALAAEIKRAKDEREVLAALDTWLERLALRTEKMAQASAI